MSRKSSFVIALILLIGGTWLYLAENFDKSFKKELINYIEKYRERGYIEYGAVEVNKYLFSIKLKDFKTVKFATYDNEVNIRYIPIIKRLDVDFNGNDYKLPESAKNDSLVIYDPKGHAKLQFTTSFFNSSEWKISITDGKAQYLESKADTKFLEYDGANILITHKREGDNHKVDFSSNIENCITGEKFREYWSYVISQILGAKYKHLVINEDFKSVGQIEALLSPFSENYRVSFMYSDIMNQRFLRLWDEFNNSENLENFYKELFDLGVGLIKEKFSLSGDSAINNQLYERSYNFNFEGNEENFQIKADIMDLVKQPLNQKLLNNIYRLLAEDFYNMLQSRYPASKVTRDDIVQVLNYFKRFNKSQFKIDGGISKNLEKIDFNIIIGSNDENMIFEGHGAITNFNLKITIPKAVENYASIVSFSNSTLMPLISKLEDNEEKIAAYNYFNNMLKNNGKNIITYINGSELSQEQPLFIDISFNVTAQPILTINKKSYNEFSQQPDFIQLENALLLLFKALVNKPLAPVLN